MAQQELEDSYIFMKILHATLHAIILHNSQFYNPWSWTMMHKVVAASRTAYHSMTKSKNRLLTCLDSSPCLFGEMLSPVPIRIWWFEYILVAELNKVL